MLFISYIKPFSKEAMANLTSAIGVTLNGMLGIFVVMFLFYIIIVGLSKIKDKE